MRQSRLCDECAHASCGVRIVGMTNVTMVECKDVQLVARNKRVSVPMWAGMWDRR